MVTMDGDRRIEMVMEKMGEALESRITGTGMAMGMGTVFWKQS